MTAQKLELPASHPLLCEAIAHQIRRSPQQRIPFAEFMQLALYHPQYGYYATNQAGQGIQSDFFTSSHLGSDFGELLAEQFAQMWHHLDRPSPFTLLEMGAGQGLLVQDILRYLHRHHFECFEAIDYGIVEQSPSLVAAQQQRMQQFAPSWNNIRWLTWDEIPQDSLVGCCFSNELVDALPVHLVTWQAGNLQEIYVVEVSAEESPGSAVDSHLEVQGGSTQTLASSTRFQFGETPGELSSDRLLSYFQDNGIDLTRYPDGYRTEVNLAAADWLQKVSDRLHQGYLLTIDYGYTAARYYSPARTQGTLQCYFRHAHHDDPYQAIGRQDITAHVNFTALEHWGESLELQTLGFTQQGLFLMALGLGDRIAALSNPNPDLPLSDLLRRRESLHALMNPMGLGNFGVLVQAKGLEAQALAQPLKGLSTPPLF
jgi:SAM-dependent MidA family methyltransferase